MDKLYFHVPRKVQISYIFHYNLQSSSSDISRLSQEMMNMMNGKGTEVVDSKLHPFFLAFHFSSLSLFLFFVDGDFLFLFSGDIDRWMPQMDAPPDV